MKPPRHLIGVLSGAIVMLAGCGSSEPPAVFDHDNVLRLKLDEYGIVPQVITIRAVTQPTIVRIVAKNTGHLTHNVHIESAGATVHGATAPDIDYGGTTTAHPGQTVRSQFIYLLPGRYRLTCTISNHDNLGQHGTLTVEPPLHP